jgi:hypothetical protein
MQRSNSLSRYLSSQKTTEPAGESAKSRTGCITSSHWSPRNTSGGQRIADMLREQVHQDGLSRPLDPCQKLSGVAAVVSPRYASGRQHIPDMRRKHIDKGSMSLTLSPGQAR